MRVAKAKGRLKGKQHKLSRRQEAHLVSLVHSGVYSTLEVAELFGRRPFHRLPSDRAATHGDEGRARQRLDTPLTPPDVGVRNRHPRGTPTREAFSEAGSERRVPTAVPPAGT